MRVFGVEGAWDRSHSVAWGAVAVHSSQYLVNSLSWSRVRLASSSFTEESEAIVQFIGQAEMPDEKARGSIGMIWTGECPIYRQIQVDASTIGVLLVERGVRQQLAVFESIETFEFVASRVAEAVALSLLGNEGDCLDEGEARQLNTALVLAPRNPYLLAIKDGFSGEQYALGTISELLLRDASGRDKYSEILRLIRATPERYQIRYKSANRDVSGLDLPVLSEQARALDTVAKRFGGRRLERVPLLGKVPRPGSPHVNAVHAGSAIFELVAEVPGETRGARLRRAAEIDALREALRGGIESTESMPVDALKALRLASNGKGDLVASHRSTNVDGAEAAQNDQFEEISDAVRDTESEARVTEESFRALCFVNGAIRELNLVELALSKSQRIVINVRGENSTAMSQAVRERDIFFRLAIAQIRRSISSDGRTKYRVEQFGRIGADWVDFDVVPSSYVDGAMLRLGACACRMIDFRVEVRLRDATILGFEFSDTGSDNKAFADKVFRKLQADVFDAVVESSRSPNAWIVPVGLRPARLDKLIFVLHRLGGRADVGKMVIEAEREFGLVSRRRDILRDVQRNAVFFESHDDTIGLSSDGEARFRIVREILDASERLRASLFT